jgi:hypothetical protein
VRPGFLIRTLIQNQRAPVGQGRDGLDLGLNLAEYPLSRPRRVGHKVLQGLPIPSVQGAVHVGKVPCGVHSQLGTQIVVGMLAGIACPGRKAATKAQPELGEVVTEVGDCFRRQSPASGGMQRRLAALRGLDRLVRHRLCSPMPAQPPQSSPGAALLQGPLGVWCHGSILRIVAEHSGPAHRLLEGLPHAILYPRSLGLERHYLAHISKRWSWVPPTSHLM